MSDHEKILNDLLNDMLSATDSSNWGDVGVKDELRNDYFRGFSDAMEIFHEMAMDYHDAKKMAELKRP